MIKIKNLNFEEFQFNIDRRLLTAKKYYNNGSLCAIIRLKQDMSIEHIKAIRVRITLQKKLPNNQWENSIETQSMVIDQSGKEVYTIPLCYIEPGDKNTVDKKYLPFVKNALKLFQEVNQDFFCAR